MIIGKEVDFHTLRKLNQEINEYKNQKYRFYNRGGYLCLLLHTSGEEYWEDWHNIGK